MTNTPPSVIIRQLLIDRELAVDVAPDVDWVAFYSHMPDDRENVICVYDTMGMSDGRIMSSGEQVEHEGIQIQIAGRDYPTAWRKANAIALDMDARHNAEVTVEEDEDEVIYSIQNISRRSTVLNMGMDTVGSKRRFRFAINATLTVREAEVVTIGYHVTDGADSIPFVVAGGLPYYVQP